MGMALWGFFTSSPGGTEKRRIGTIASTENPDRREGSLEKQAKHGNISLYLTSCGYVTAPPVKTFVLFCLKDVQTYFMTESS